jgi:hypothetical protein
MRSTPGAQIAPLPDALASSRYIQGIKWLFVFSEAITMALSIFRNGNPVREAMEKRGQLALF